MNFGDKLKDIRVKRGMSQEEFADMLGTTKQVISRYETNQRTPKITMVNDFAEKLGISLAELVGWEDATFPRLSTSTVNSEVEIKTLISRLESAHTVMYGNLEMDETAKAMLLNSLEGLIQNLELIVKK